MRGSLPLLDLSCLRSFIAVAQQGSLSAAASAVNFSQSALSLQMQRLEDQLGQPLLLRHARGVRLTHAGETLLGHAKTIIEANRRAVTEVMGTTPARPLRLGVPHDVLNPHVPAAMRRFSDLRPSREVLLQTASSRDLCNALSLGELDIVLSTEFETPNGARAIASRQVGWVAAKGSTLGLRRPLPLAFTKGCVIRTKAIAVLEAAGLDYTLAVETSDVRAVEAAVAADRAVHAMIIDDLPTALGHVDAAAGLPALPPVAINLHVADTDDADVRMLALELQRAFAA